MSINSQPYSKGERTLFKPSGFKTAIALHKTDVSATVDTGYTASTDNDPARYCPVQRKAHPLDRCRSFRIKTLQERKTILKEHKHCFKCSSPNHLAKDCQATLKCGVTAKDTALQCTQTSLCLPIHCPIHKQQFPTRDVFGAPKSSARVASHAPAQRCAWCASFPRGSQSAPSRSE